MPRQPRNNLETTYFHIIVQGIGKESIFKSGALKAEYLKDISLFKDVYGVKLLTYCVMDNHSHLLIYSPDVTALADFMHRVNTRFAQWYNKLNDRVGYVFRDRYRSQPVCDESYLLNCMVYIHNNPVKAGVVQEAADYSYSGLQNYYTHMGPVDFECAAQFFDTSADNIEAVMNEKSAAADENCPVWEDVKEEAATAADIAASILAGQTVKPSLLRHDKETLRAVVGKMHTSGLTYKEISDAVGIPRSTLYTLL